MLHKELINRKFFSALQYPIPSNTNFYAYKFLVYIYQSDSLIYIPYTLHTAQD